MPYLELSTEKNRNYCRPEIDTIFLNMEKRVFNRLTDDDLIIYLTDVITHESIHIALYKTFNNLTISQLFDSIGDKLRSDIQLKKYVNTVTKRMLWSEALKLHPKYLYKHYFITDVKLKIMHDVVNKREEFF